MQSNIVDIDVSNVFDWNSQSEAPVIVNQGGTYSGKTYNILIVLFCRAVAEPESIITVVSQDVPHLKAGALRDAEKIVKSSKVFQQEIASYNKTDRVYFFRNGSIIEFKSLKDAQDSHGGKRDYLFVNEANGIPYDIYTQLALRTSKQVFIDYNPQENFWVMDHIIPAKGTVLFVSDHRDNPFIDQSTRDKIEALKDVDIELWKVYARGLTGKFEGLILNNYSFVENIPDDATLLGGALDFGYTNDPTAFLLVYKFNGELWIDELIYETGLTNPDIAGRLRESNIQRNMEIIADCAEPKSIQEIRSEGFHLTAAKKGPDSVRQGIDILKRFKLNITHRSRGLRVEVRRYKWKQDRTGKHLNEPVSFMNHSIDALRYLALSKLATEGGGNYCWA